MASLKKRQKAIGRFSHNAEQILIGEKILLQGKTLSYDEILDKIPETDRLNNCYVISDDYEMDCKSIPFESALQKAYDIWGTVILISRNTAFIKEETECGAAFKYLMNIV